MCAKHVRVEPSLMPAESQSENGALGSPRQDIGEYLIKRGLVRRDALEAALREQAVTNEQIGAILVRNGFVAYHDYVEAILALSPEKIINQYEDASGIPPEILRRLGVTVVNTQRDAVLLSSLAPEWIVRDQLQQYFPGKTLKFCSLSPDALDGFISRSLQSNAGNTTNADDHSRILDKLLNRALAEDASDVHFVPRTHSYTVLFRRLGVRHIAHEGTLAEYDTVAAQIKDRARMDLAERRVPQDGGFQIERANRLVDLRVATMPGVYGEHIVVRVLDPDRARLSLTELGITRLDEWAYGVSRTDGICLICGPTGSGKTTTLTATIREMDRFSKAIWTIEDPVEFRVPYVGQVSINPSVGLDFARAVRSFMRADPDVIVVGEIRDAETARNALVAADTGHLVLATLHTGSIQGTITRLRDLGVPMHEFKHSLRAVLVQRLARIACRDCRGKGCANCFNTGYAGRTAVSECVAFRGEDNVQRLMEGERWWPRMIEDAIEKYRAGVTTKRELRRIFGSELDDIINGANGGGGQEPMAIPGHEVLL